MPKPRAAEPDAACANGARLTTTQFIPVGRAATGLATGDFNHDGSLDFVLTEFPLQEQFGAVTTLLGNGRGGFAIVSRTPIGLSGNSSSGLPRFYPADFNRDGALDLGILGIQNGFAIFHGNGDGSLRAPVILTSEGVTPSGVSAVGLADFNGDNTLDVALSVTGAIQIRLANSNGGFNAAISYAANFTGALAAADFTGDGKPDLVYGEPNAVRLLVNNGSGAFTLSPNSLSASFNTIRSLLAGDFNADNKTDLVATDLTDSWLLYGNGSGGFSAPENLGVLFLRPRTADFNGDQRTDLVAITDETQGAFVHWRGKTGGGFDAPQFYGLPQNTFGPAIGDFNGDNLPDVAFAQREPNGIAIAFNNGSGGFHAPRATRREVGGNDFYFPGDVNQDGKLDLMGNGIWLNDGPGAFTRLTARGTDGIGSDTTFRWLGLGDFNRGQRPELAWSYLNFGDGNYYVTLGTLNDNLELNAGRGFVTGREPAAAVVTDYNRDGNLDLVIALAGDHTVALLAGNGRGAFAPAVTLPVGLEPRSLAQGDFTGDARLDFIVANRNSATLTLLRQEADCAFTPLTIGLNASPYTVHAFDINRDGKLDVLVPLANTAAVALLAGNGDGTFRPLSPLAVSRATPEIAVGDFTSDDKLDLAVSYPTPTNPNVPEVPQQMFRGDGQGGFTLTQEFPAPNSGQVFAADFTGDAMTDLLLIKGRYFWTMPSTCLTPATATLANVSAANYQSLPLAPESIVAAFGTEFSTQTVAANTIPLPTRLGGVSISVRGNNNLERAASLFFVSPNQINYLLPAGLAVGVATVTVTTSANVSKRETILIAPTAPGIFTANADGKDIPSALLLRRKNGGDAITTESVTRFDTASQRYVLRPLRIPNNETLYLVLFGTGWRNQKNVQVRLDDAELMEVLYAGAQGSLIGLDQMNLGFSFGPTARLHTVDVTVDGKIANRIGVLFEAIP